MLQTSTGKPLGEFLADFATEMTMLKESVPKHIWDELKGCVQMQIDADFDPFTANELLTKRMMDKGCDPNNPMP